MKNVIRIVFGLSCPSYVVGTEIPILAIFIVSPLIPPFKTRLIDKIKMDTDKI